MHARRVHGVRSPVTDRGGYSRAVPEGFAEVSVIVPTIGRERLLDACLASLVACVPRAQEVLVIDQSDGRVADLLERYANLGVRRLACPSRGIPLAVNAGVRAARCSKVAITHDDCTVGQSWVGIAAAGLDEHGEQILTGRVRPVGDSRAVPATRDDPHPRVYSASDDIWAIMPNNMAVRREEFLSFGGFDERFDLAGEDLDLTTRWIWSGHTVRYIPALEVWHHHWRDARGMRRTYVEYARGCGLFYAKNLRRQGLLRDAMDLVKGLRAAVVRPSERWYDDRLGALRGLPIGLWQGWRRFGQ
jgi:GT2 family glycosyltransferase